MPHILEIAMVSLNLLAGAGVLALLGVLTWISWGAVRSRTAPRSHLLRAVRQRLVSTVWVVIVIFVATAAYGEVTSASVDLPHVWEIAVADENRAYAFLILGAYLLVVQVILGLSVLTWKGSKRAPATLAHPDRARDSGLDLGAALISTLGLAAMGFAVVAMTVAGYLQLLAHGLV